MSSSALGGSSVADDVLIASEKNSQAKGLQALVMLLIFFWIIHLQQNFIKVIFFTSGRLI